MYSVSKKERDDDTFMRILAVGDIVGKVGLQKLKAELPRIVNENKIDFVIVNGENAADGILV